MSDLPSATTRATFLYGTHFADSTEQGLDVHWEARRGGLGLELLLRQDDVPVLDQLPVVRDFFQHLYIGLQTNVARASGHFGNGGQNLARYDLNSFSVSVPMQLLFEPAEWLRLRAGAALGYEGGNINADLNAAGRELLEPTCPEPEKEKLVDDPGAATEAIQCGLKNEVGLYNAFPLTLTAGIRLFHLVDLDLQWQRETIYASDDIFAPGRMQTLFGVVGVRIKDF